MSEKRQIPLSHLEAFDAMVRGGGAKQGGAELGVKGTLISQYVGLLQKRLRTRLYDYEKSELRLTSDGERLRAITKPFFEQFEKFQAELRAAIDNRISIGAADIILHGHLPNVIARMRKDRAAKGGPELQVELVSLLAEESRLAVENGRIDLAVTTRPSRPIEGCTFTELVPLPLVLLANEAATPGGSFEEIVAVAMGNDGVISQPLIALPEGDPMRDRFQKVLKDKGLDWPVSLETNSVQLVQAYVAAECGYGLTVRGAAPVAPGLREIELTGFGSLEFGILHPNWEDLKQVCRDFILGAQAYVGEMFGAA